MFDEEGRFRSFLSRLGKIKAGYWEVLIGFLIGTAFWYIITMNALNTTIFLGILQLLLLGIILIRLWDRVPKASTESMNSPFRTPLSESSKSGSGNDPTPLIMMTTPKMPKPPTPCPECGSTRRHKKTCPRNKENQKA